MTVRCSHIFLKTHFQANHIKIQYLMNCFFKLKIPNHDRKYTGKEYGVSEHHFRISFTKLFFSKRHINYHHNSTLLFGQYVISELPSSLANTEHIFRLVSSPTFTHSLPEARLFLLPKCSSMLFVFTQSQNQHDTHFGFIILSEQFAWIKYTQTH